MHVQVGGGDPRRQRTNATNAIGPWGARDLREAVETWDGVSRGSSIPGMRQLATSLLELTPVSARACATRSAESVAPTPAWLTIIFSCDSRLTALSDAERSSVEPQYYSTYRELQLRISTIPTLKSTELVGCLLAACRLLVGCLF